ncbi:mitochondrial import receptor subunit TOM40 [Patellaria atrata CBS 101060]|uniref:Translocase of outer membrane 40 kDa subunit n=1 Tax=Patellaria atrata CBS 101060 TaxID=1346257 RepID=A0A9P4S9H1_9PEZI|nr:mitochondrial import receptor subunit TOM40 [Patellaria atrata CBS 101060]
MSLSEKNGALELITGNAVAQSLNNLYTSFHERRDSLGLSNPGTVENIAKEVSRDVFLNNLSFSGLRADLTKAFSVAPLFQISHALSMGSQGLPPYTYSVLYGSSKVFMQASLDNELSLTGRFNYRWNQGLVTKTSTQMQGGQAMFSIDNDYTGSDFSASLKAMNPNILDGGITGIWVGSWLQSVTPRLALGIEAVWQRQTVNMGPEMALSYAGKYKGDDWTASAQLLSQGAVQATYWRRLMDRVEVGADCTLSFAGLGIAGSGALMGGGIRKEGVATLGAKYDFRTQSSFRAQIDSQGRLGALLEKRVAPPVSVTFAGEIDHAKNTAKVGLAVSIEAAGEEVMEQQETMAQVTPPF